jgi:hypothetical protein
MVGQKVTMDDFPLAFVSHLPLLLLHCTLECQLLTLPYYKQQMIIVGCIALIIDSQLTNNNYQLIVTTP